MELPGVVSLQEIDLQFTKRVLHLDVATDARGTLVIDLPEPVLLEPRAKFLKKTRQLRVDLVPATTLPLAEAGGRCRRGPLRRGRVAAESARTAVALLLPLIVPLRLPA